MATKKTGNPRGRKPGSGKSSESSNASTAGSSRSSTSPTGQSSSSTSATGSGSEGLTSQVSATGASGQNSRTTGYSSTNGSTASGSSGSSVSSGTSKASKKNSPKKQQTLETLFESLLNDVYSAEKQLLEALPKMADASYTEDLQDAFDNHLRQTKKHVERIEKVFSKLRLEKEENKCEAMEGLIKESEEVLEEFEEGPVRDSALIICAQKVEHYEIASYGSLCELADVLGWKKIGEILGRTLDEEEETDHILTEIAMGVNDEAYELSEQEEESEEEVY